MTSPDTLTAMILATIKTQLATIKVDGARVFLAYEGVGFTGELTASYVDRVLANIARNVANNVLLTIETE